MARQSWGCAGEQVDVGQEVDLEIGGEPVEDRRREHALIAATVQREDAEWSRRPSILLVEGCDEIGRGLQLSALHADRIPKSTSTTIPLLTT